MKTFDKNFEFGTAVSAPQIEDDNSNKESSIWDDYFSLNNQLSDERCNHYEHWKTDFDLLSSLSVNAYRFSIAWTRVEKEGGEPNEIGMNYYQEQIDDLIFRGIKPCITLYHWDLPSWIQKEGGWENPNIIKHFTRYVSLMLNRFGNKITRWITLNEPRVIVERAYTDGSHPPHVKDKKRANQVFYNLVLAHKTAYQLFKKSDNLGSMGISLNLKTCYPYDPFSEKDKIAADLMDKEKNVKYLNAFYEAGVDFIGINNYSICRVSQNIKTGKIVNMDGPGKKTSMGWEICPQGLYDIIIKVTKMFPEVDIIITENGISLDNDGIDDPDRIEYLEQHLDAIKRAIDMGANVLGYYVWSFMDNKEWTFGYKMRFGLVYVDHKTQTRIIKKSGKWYADFIRKTLNK